MRRPRNLKIFSWTATPPFAAQALASGTWRLRKYRQPDPGSVIGSDSTAGGLEIAPLPFLLEALLSRPEGCLGFPPRFGDDQRLGDQGLESLASVDPIAELASGGRGHHTNPPVGVEATGQLVEKADPFGVRERGAQPDVPPQFNPGGGLVDVLAAGAAGPGGPELEFGLWDLHGPPTIIRLPLLHEPVTFPR